MLVNVAGSGDGWKQRAQLALWTERPTSALVGAGSFWLRVDFKEKHPRLNMEPVSPSKWHAWPQLLITCLKHITERGPGFYESTRGWIEWVSPWESTTQMLIWSPHVSSNPRYRVRESGRGLTDSRSHSACGQASPVGRGEARLTGNVGAGELISQPKLVHSPWH